MKLEGLRVLDLSSFLPGPYLTVALADHGADVLKIEAPGGDHARKIGVVDGDHTVLFRSVNRGKRSVVLDLKDPEQMATLRRLADEADVFVESYRPGVAARLGIDYATLAATNPRLVYCSISAFGQTGPYRLRAAHDLAVEAISGVSSITIGDDGRPAMPAIPVGDIVAGLQGLSGVLMALLRRERTGLGDYVDISMLDSTFSAATNVLGPALGEGRQQEPRLERTTGGAAFYRYYETSDGRFIALAGQEEKFIRNLLNHFGRPDLVEACLSGPGGAQAPVMQFLESVFLTATLEEWLAELAALDVCYGPVNTLPEGVEDPQLRARGMIVTDLQGRSQPGTPIMFAREPGLTGSSIPKLGGDQAVWL